MQIRLHTLLNKLKKNCKLKLSVAVSKCKAEQLMTISLVDKCKKQETTGGAASNEDVEGLVKSLSK